MTSFYNNSPITRKTFENELRRWSCSKPFNHIVLESFLVPDIALKIAQEFPVYESGNWRTYDNPLEIKKLINHWDSFGPTTYSLFQYLNSANFISLIEPLVGCKLFPDYGLNGGGLHSHRRGGKLNVHLDYSIHPKLGLQRKLNLLVYLTPDWFSGWGGELGFWSAKAGNCGPDELVKKISPAFNTAVLFDTTQDSWHGLPDPINCPDHVTRNSIAVYYLCEPHGDIRSRPKALFAPSEGQRNDPAILELIARRSNLLLAPEVYESTGEDRVIKPKNDVQNPPP